MRAYQPDAFQPDAFQVEPVSIEITQTAPGFTQTGTGTVGEFVPPEMGDVLGQMFRFRPPRVLFDINVSVRQTAPAFTQSLAVRVTDDELVFMLI